MNKNLKKLIIETLKDKISKKGETSKLLRDIFLYYEPKEPYNQFAQCSTCRMWTGKTCNILGKDIKITGDMSCGAYIHGKPSVESRGEELKILTPKEVGLVKRKVRCENCRSFKNNICLLYKTLNESNPNLFDLNEKVNSHGCCNAQKSK